MIARCAARRAICARDIEPRLATRLLFGMLNSITEWYRPGGELGAQDIAEAVFRIAFEGLKAERSRGVLTNQPNGW